MAESVLKKSLPLDIQYDMRSLSPQPENNYSLSTPSLNEADVFSTCSPSQKQLSSNVFQVNYDDLFSDNESTDYDFNIYMRLGKKSQKAAPTSLAASPISNYLYSANVYESECYESSENGFNSLYNSITENWLLKPPPFILKHLTKSSRIPVNLEKYRIKEYKPESLRKTIPESPKIEVDNRARIYRPTHVRSYSDGTKFIKRIHEPMHLLQNDKTPYSSDMSLRIKSNKRFMEDGGHSIETGAYGFFPRPRPGQHLFDFLYDCYMTTTNAQLDRENAHFSIAEAVIGAIEQMNYDAQMKDMVAKSNYASRGSENKKLPVSNKRLQNKIKLKNTSESRVCTLDEPVRSGTVHEKSSDESLTDHSASAENVAISLLLNYNSNLLPKAIDLKWRFFEEEELNKKCESVLDNSSTDESLEVVGNTAIRGTADWAPPRPQLILTIHKKFNRMGCIVAQSWRCAGCGLQVCNKMSRHFRFCSYLGKYFCTSCHTNKKCIIPANVIFNWDFCKYAVSNFSSELLLRMQSDPLFNISSLNVSLFKQTQSLNQCHVYRLQLFHARKYVVTCRNAVKENELLNSVPIHWSTEPHVYSIDDLLAVKSNSLLIQIMNLTSMLIKHISSCQVCLGQGFVCEMCKKGTSIFPFQLDAVTQCTKCKACYHVQCFIPGTVCARCVRRGRKQERSNSNDFGDLLIR